MANFRAIPTKIWADDIFLSMSPEQKMIFIYLHTSPYVTQCGIYKLPIRTMGFHLGYTHNPVESALVGFCAAFPDFAAWDKETGEVALLQYPNMFLKDAPQKIWNYVIKELAEVKSIELLKKVIEKSSATTAKPYLSRLRSLNMEVQNLKRDNVNILLDIDVAKPVENQIVISEIEKEKKRKEKKEKSELTDKEIFVRNEEKFWQWFWNTYDKKTNEHKCRMALSCTDYDERIKILESLPKYIKSEPDKRWRTAPLRWLEGKRWNDEIFLDDEQKIVNFKITRKINLDEIER